MGVNLLAELPPDPPRIARAMNRLTFPRTAPHQVLRVHRWLYEHSDGRVGHGMIGAPTLLLRTKGRQTGQQRCAALNYVPDGDSVIVGASNAGAGSAPAWLHNLRSDPVVEIQIGRQHLWARAAVLEPSHPDYPRLWELMNGTNHGRYDWWQAHTSRPIPLVAITPERLVSQ